MINSKRKGKMGELNLVKKLKEYGYNCVRTEQYNGKAEDSEADLRGLQGIHIEVKNREKHNIYDYIEQVKRDKNDNEIGTVFIKSNNKEWLCLLTLDDFMRLYKGV